VKDRERFASDEINTLGDFVNAIFPVKKCCQDKAQEIIAEVEKFTESDRDNSYHCFKGLDICKKNCEFYGACIYVFLAQLKQKWGIMMEQKNEDSKRICYEKAIGHLADASYYLLTFDEFSDIKNEIDRIYNRMIAATVPEEGENEN